MKNLILLSIIFILVVGCKKEEKGETNVFTLKGKWLSWDDAANSEIAVKSTEWIEFSDNSYESVFNEKMVMLPDCTLVYKIKRIVTSEYSVHDRFIKFTNMNSDTNGVAEFKGKTMYMIYTYADNELILSKAEMWQQLSGTSGQIKDGLFYQLDSCYDNKQDSTTYYHFKLDFAHDIVNYYVLTNGSRNMPDVNANWDVKTYRTEITDHTFLYAYGAYYQFVDGFMISISTGIPDILDFQKSYMSYAYYLSLLGK